MLFRKKQPKACEYCIYSTTLSEDQVLCSKHGIRPPETPCHGFKYDPIKRIPPNNNILNLDKYSQEDFTL